MKKVLSCIFIIFAVLQLSFAFPKDSVFFDFKEYDKNGKLVLEKWDDNTVIEYLYDKKGNWIGKKQSDGVTSRCVKTDSRIITETYSNGIITTYRYLDDDCKILTEEKSVVKEMNLETTTVYLFNEKGNETMFIYYSPNGTCTSWNEYDENNRLVKRTNSYGDEYYYEYEFYKNGSVKKRICYVKRNQGK